MEAMPCLLVAWRRCYTWGSGIEDSIPSMGNVCLGAVPASRQEVQGGLFLTLSVLTGSSAVFGHFAFEEAELHRSWARCLTEPVCDAPGGVLWALSLVV